MTVSSRKLSVCGAIAICGIALFLVFRFLHPPSTPKVDYSVRIDEQGIDFEPQILQLEKLGPYQAERDGIPVGSFTPFDWGAFDVSPRQRLKLSFEMEVSSGRCTPGSIVTLIAHSETTVTRSETTYKLYRDKISLSSGLAEYESGYGEPRSTCEINIQAPAAPGQYVVHACHHRGVAIKPLVLARLRLNVGVDQSR